MLKGIEQICSICTNPNCNMSTTKAFISCVQSVLVTVYSRFTFHISSVTNYFLLLSLSGRFVVHILLYINTLVIFTIFSCLQVMIRVMSTMCYCLKCLTSLLG